jgi:hypothetical protein
MRHAALALVFHLLLAACRREPERAPGAPPPSAERSAEPPAPASAPPRTAAASAREGGGPPASPASPPAAGVDARFLGTYAVAEGEPGKPSRLVLVDVGEKGAGSPRTLITSAREPFDGVAFSVDGATVVYVTSKPGQTADKDGQTISAIPRAGGSPRRLARCGYQCVVLGVGRDGEVWFVDEPTMSLIGELYHVALRGGPAVKWAHRFASCALGGVVSADGETLVLAVTNALGWPDCIATGAQGFYLVPIADRARRDALPPRTTCFPSPQKPTEINLSIDPVMLDAPDRFAFGGGDAWAEGGDGADVFWSCKLDGTGARRLSSLPPHVAPRTLDGKEWLAVVSAAMPRPDEKPTLLAGPFDKLLAFAGPAGR